MANKVLSFLDPQSSGEYRKSLFFPPVPEHLLLTYFRYIKDNHNFYIPVSHIKGDSPKLYFSTNPKYFFGSCRIFLLRADCEDWCFDLTKNGARESIVCLPMPAKSLLAMMPRIAEDRKKSGLPCTVECYTALNGLDLLVDVFYEQTNMMN